MLRLDNDILYIELPQGKTQAQLIDDLESEFSTIEKDFHGKDIKLNGRLTTGMAMWLGHKLAHICKSVSIFDPKINGYIKVIEH